MSARPGASSGRQRRQGRNPACSADAADSKNLVRGDGAARWTDRTAIDLRRRDADEEDAVETGVARAEGALANVGGQHPLGILHRRTNGGWPDSDLHLARPIARPNAASAPGPAIAS